MANQFDRYAPTKTPTQIAREQRKAIQAEKRAVAPKQAQNQPGSGQLTPNTYAMPAVPRPSQLPQRTAPAAGGVTSVANPPPTGNLAPQRVTTVQLGSTARNPYDFASGRGTTADAERWQKQNGGSISSRIYTPTSSNAPTPGREAMLDAAMSPEMQAQKAQQTASNDMMRIEQQYGTTTTQQRRPATTASESGAGRFPRGNAQSPGMIATSTTVDSQEPGSATSAKPFQYAAQPTQENQNWRQTLLSKHPKIGIAGSPENEAFVAAFKQHGDPNRAMETADQLFEQASAKKIAAAEGAGATEFAPLSTEADTFAGDEQNGGGTPEMQAALNIYSPVGRARALEQTPEFRQIARDASDRRIAHRYPKKPTN